MKPRYKKAKRILNFYSNTFGLKPPYKVLVCGTFCKQALSDQINIAEQLPKYMSGEVKLFTTKCAIKECELGESLLFGPLKVLRQYDKVDCPHSWFKGAPKCLLKSATNGKTQFFVATQDEELQEKLRAHNVPLLHISHNSINLESPSDTSTGVAKEKVTQKLTLSEKQQKSISKMKVEMGLVDPEIRKRKKKKKGPNPLSCKKKKPAQNIQKQNKFLGVKDGGIQRTQKRRRKKK